MQKKSAHDGVESMRKRIAQGIECEVIDRQTLSVSLTVGIVHGLGIKIAAFKSNGQFFGPGFLEKGVEGALRAGFSGLRASGDVVWELGHHVDMELLSHYEVCLDHFFFGKKLTGLCQYNCKVVSSEYLRRSLMCHNAVVLEEKVALHNPYHNFPLPSIAPPLNRMLTGLT